MLTTTQLQRVFLFTSEGQTLSLADPDPCFSPQMVLNFYANTYPILTTATIEGPEITGDNVRYRFTSTIGTKG